MMHECSGFNRDKTGKSQKKNLYVQLEALECRFSTGIKVQVFLKSRKNFIKGLRMNAAITRRGMVHLSTMRPLKGYA